MNNLLKKGPMIGLLLCMAVATSCQTTIAQKEYPQIPSYSISQTEKTTLGNAIRLESNIHKGKSGFRVLKTGSEAYEMRLALIRAAEKTIDLQYYSIHDDITANLLMEAILQAAQRGVRIRLLIDGINMDELADTLSLVDEFKNVEIRVFNPFATRDDGLLKRAVTAITDMDSFNHRMHNKALISDNQMAIIGGRNLGDEYFEENTDRAFRDIDMLVAGPVTDKISHSFDEYWNDKKSVPIAQIAQPKKNAAPARQLRLELENYWNGVLATDKGKKILSYKLTERLKDADIRLTWAPVDIAADKPHKVDEPKDSATSKPLNRLDQLLEHAKTEFIAVSPYFVPQQDGVEWLRSLVARGIKVRILTNSLSSTDVVAVHSGYRRYRADVVNSGVDLYEMKATDGAKPHQRLIGKTAPARASLHGKVYVVDRRDVMIGSFNLDPRSVSLNTEIALVIHSTEIARQIVDMFNEVTSPKSSYHVVLDKDGKLAWQTELNGKMMQSEQEPGGFWRGIETNIMSLLPIENNL